MHYFNSFFEACALHGKERVSIKVQGSSHLPQQLKFTTSDSCDRIKDEFQLLQAQYHSLKLECDKLASEKSEMQRHYVMYYEMSYGLNIEMHKQTEPPGLLGLVCTCRQRPGLRRLVFQAEIVKRLNGYVPRSFLPFPRGFLHQQQVLEPSRELSRSLLLSELHHPSITASKPTSCPSCRLWPAPDPTACGAAAPSLPAVSAGTGLLSLSALGSRPTSPRKTRTGMTVTPTGG
ncbi:Amino-terminal enhancer of split [Camelus dromedarius]|uniref:Amino-terminal enhancer of split n=1 Tax=Camelus dromedarius TaxID=9838 RepID=A0A5N4CMQ4_CAMDR|nr:Amino-terminal enhancer of split [Camelus dromedarius]